MVISKRQFKCGRKVLYAVSPLLGAEQAEVGQWPYLLALCYRYTGFKYPTGILVAFASPLGAIYGILSGIPLNR